LVDAVISVCGVEGGIARIGERFDKLTKRIFVIVQYQNVLGHNFYPYPEEQR
jgi:hypothetical protein